MDVRSWFRRGVSRPRKTNLPSASANNGEEELYGITERLIGFVKSFSLETFRDFSLPDEEGGDSGGDGSSGNVRKDLSDWQERHAMLILSKVKELSQLRFRLCPRYLKEQEFWRIYFRLVKNYVAQYELLALQNEKLKQIRMENDTVPDTNSCEVEMSETKLTNAVPATSSDDNLD